MPRPNDQPAQVGEHTVAEGVEPAFHEPDADTIRHPDLARALDALDEQLGTQD